ncbi:hypothetical protein JR316_0009322 [Psilocybe cubensis]|uniref:Uncharacterized protein n=2 Tax=Psilocybe cubensis TaxID=181762 RepID=A0ACB8GTQ9_PSICU|nr:hypothetical protein JR316_0009322 [Psilocybe cubensis]KAH9478860.1 hypothetical protein JR316_0009322 [Psilocybe cubensis]
MKDETSLLREKLRVCEEKLSRTTMVLQERNAELIGTRTFLTATDVYSSAEIIQMVNALNADIFQLAAVVADLFENEAVVATEEERARNLDAVLGHLNAVFQVIGAELSLQLTGTYKHLRQDPFALQLAIQAFITHTCMQKTQVFSENQGGQFMVLYKKIKSFEQRTVATRWRAIASAHIPDPDLSADTEAATMGIKSILYLCLWSSSESQIRVIESKAAAILKLSYKLKKAMHEGIITGDMETFIIPPGGHFNDSMENGYVVDKECDTAEKANRVLCTVGMGLKKVVMPVSKSGEVEMALLVKPVVVLNGVF